MCHPVWLFSRKYGTVWYHPACSKHWYLTTLSFVNFQEKLTGTSRDSLHVWSQLVRLAVCLALGARFASTLLHNCNQNQTYCNHFLPLQYHPPNATKVRNDLKTIVLKAHITTIFYNGCNTTISRNQILGFAIHALHLLQNLVVDTFFYKFLLGS
jgi:hypothetical protein